MGPQNDLSDDDHSSVNGVVPDISNNFSSINLEESKRMLEEPEAPRDGLQEENGHAVVPLSKVELKREMGLFSAVCLIISVMIGSGIFVSPSSVLDKSGSVGFCLIIWALCGFLSYLGALAFGELGVVVGESGAEYAYFQASFSKLGSGNTLLGPVPAFLYAFLMVLVVRPAEVAILVLTFSEYSLRPLADYLPENLPHDQLVWYEKLLGIIGVSLITFINCMSVRWYVVIQNLFSSLKVIACLIVIAGGIYYLCIGQTQNVSTGFDGTKTSAKDVALAFYSGLWAFDGWTSVTVVSEEIKRPERNIPYSISIGVPFVTILYFMMNVAYMSVLTVPEMIKSPAVALSFGEILFGPVSFLISIAVVLSTFGCALSVQFGVSRLCYSAARNGHMLEALSYINTNRMTPLPAVLLQGLLSVAFILSGGIIELIEFVSFLIWIFYGMAMISLIILRKTRAETPRPYKVPLIIPVFVVIISAYLSLVPLILSPDPQFLVALGAIIIGLIIYYPLVYKKMHPSFMNKINAGVKKILHAAPPDSKSRSLASPGSNAKPAQPPAPLTNLNLILNNDSKSHTTHR